MEVWICKTAVQPREIKTASSKGDGTVYTTITPTIFNDAVCSCPGYNFRGTCRHAKSLTEAQCTYYESGDAESLYEGSTECPNCGAEMIPYNMEPQIK